VGEGGGELKTFMLGTIILGKVQIFGKTASPGF